MYTKFWNAKLGVSFRFEVRAQDWSLFTPKKMRNKATYCAHNVVMACTLDSKEKKSWWYTRRQKWASTCKVVFKNFKKNHYGKPCKFKADSFLVKALSHWSPKKACKMRYFFGYKKANLLKASIYLTGQTLFWISHHFSALPSLEHIHFNSLSALSLMDQCNLEKLVIEFF